MTAFVIVLLILFGIILLLLEFLVVPGITIAGVGGALMIAGGILLSYITYGNTWGHLTLVLALAFCALVLIVALKSRTWDKLMLNTEVEGKVEKFEENDVKVGDTGIAVTRLAPMGKISVNDITLEAKSIGPLIDEKTPVVVIKVFNKSVIVKPKN